jgi:hypothetical protein
MAAAALPESETGYPSQGGTCAAEEQAGTGTIEHKTILDFKLKRL